MNYDLKFNDKKYTIETITLDEKTLNIVHLKT